MAIRIGFFIPNKSLGEIDYEVVTKYNPGIGGTEYLFALNAIALSAYEDLDITVFLEDNLGKFPDSINVVVGGTLKESIKLAGELGINIFISKHNPEWIRNGSYSNIPSFLEIVIWNHILLNKRDLDYYYHNRLIKAIICVGREHLDLYMDHPVFNKMFYIYNGLPFPDKKLLLSEIAKVQNRKNIVTYIGSILPFKGFHWLAKAWPSVLNEVPDAELYVIGSGNLYDRNIKLGKFGITNEQYENEFMNYLTDEYGKLLPSVHFLGKIGEEKNEILKITKVGVPNPMGYNETFCISAVDMQIYGCSTVSIKCPAYLDTIIDQSKLANSSRSLSTYIIRELHNPKNINYSNVYDKLVSKFDYKVVAAEWHSFLLTLNNKSIQSLQLKNIPYLWSNYKWWRFFIFKLYGVVPIIAVLFTKFQYSRFVNKIKRLIHNFEYYAVR